MTIMVMKTRLKMTTNRKKKVRYMEMRRKMTRSSRSPTSPNTAWGEG